MCLLLLGVLTSCFETVDKGLLLGKWQGVEWTVEGQPGAIDATQASFHFMEDGTYTYMYGENSERGTYYTSYQELYTTPDGGIKMMVKIQKLTSDSLIFEMNRGGQGEKLVLLKMK